MKYPQKHKNLVQHAFWFERFKKELLTKGEAEFSLPTRVWRHPQYIEELQLICDEVGATLTGPFHVRFNKHMVGTIE